MLLSKKTIDILNNFSLINSSIFLLPGKVIRTQSPDKGTMAEAVIEEDFPKEIPIYDLSQFLKVMKMFDENASLSFEDHFFTIKQKNFSQKYFYSSSDVVKNRKEEFKKIDYNFNFDLSREDLNSVLEAATVNNSSHIMIQNIQDKLKVAAVRFDDHKETIANKSNNFFIEMEGVSFGTHFTYFLKREFFRMLKTNYTVSIYVDGEDPSKKLVNFESASLKYWIMADRSSRWNGK